MGEPISYLGGGIVYKEEYQIYTAQTTGSSSGITYFEIDYDSNKQTIYNDDFNLKREGIVSKIIEKPFGEIWNKEEATTTPAFKEDFLNGICEQPKVSVNITVNRGRASAFESHFKLTECNTLEDLENYGNNFFNL